MSDQPNTEPDNPEGPEDPPPFPTGDPEPSDAGDLPRDHDYVKVVPVEHKTGSKQAGGWRWQRFAANHKLLSNNAESYEDRSYTIEMAKGVNPGITVFDDEGNVL